MVAVSLSRFGDLPFGYDHKYVFSELGFNVKATEMQAAVGRAQLAKLPEFVRLRRAHHRRLSDLLAPLGGLLLLQEATTGQRAKLVRPASHSDG